MSGSGPTVERTAESDHSRRPRPRETGAPRMADVVLFHHLQGLTDGVQAFGDELRAGGHEVHTPDLFDGQRPASLDDGFALVQSLGDDTIGQRVDAALDGLPAALVYAGFSFGAGQAQRLAQTRPGARGALLYE